MPLNREDVENIVDIYEKNFNKDGASSWVDVPTGGSVMPHTPWKAELSCFSDADYCTWAVYDQESDEVCRVFEGEEPARLIAQAPAMYELLKELQWHDEHLHYSICPICEGMEHSDDCRLAAVLKAVEGET